MSNQLTPWSDLLSGRFSNVSDEFGPASQSIVSALTVINKTRWLQRVGEPVLGCAESSRLTIVQSWDEALTIFGDDNRFNANGVLGGALRVCRCSPRAVPERKRWWQAARDEAKRYTGLGGWIPTSLPEDTWELLFENLYEFVSMLLVELIAAPEADCTYFRSQLEWFTRGTSRAAGMACGHRDG